MFEFSYKNEGKRMVVLRCIGPSKFFLERVLFPMEIELFQEKTLPDQYILERPFCNLYFYRKIQTSEILIFNIKIYFLNQIMYSNLPREKFL